MYLTLEDVAKLNVKLNAPMTDAQILDDLIKKREGEDEERKWMDQGVNYYTVNNDILGEDFAAYIDQRGLAERQANKADNRLAHAFLWRLVNEKIGYLLKEPVIIAHDKEDVVAQIFKFINREDFNNTLIQWGINASLKRREWLHPFINEQGELDFMIFDARRVIPIYEKSRQKRLVSAIRYYTVHTDEGGEVHERYHVEWYNDTNVLLYEQNKLGKYEFKGKKPHFTAKLKFRDISTERSWGRTPLVELRNNEEMISDLEPVKTLIDAYDRSQSLLTNNLEDIQEAFIHISGTGEKASELRDNLRKFKIAVSEEPEGKMTQITIDIPHEARAFQLKQIEENIYTYGMGINPKTDILGNNPSGVALKWLYLPLDLKAGKMETQFKKALRELFWFISKYMDYKKVKIDETKYTFIFNKSMIANEMEQIQNAINAKGVLSEETVLENMPWVDDVEKEKDRLEEDREKQPKMELGIVE